MVVFSRILILLVTKIGTYNLKIAFYIVTNYTKMCIKMSSGSENAKLVSFINGIHNRKKKPTSHQGLI